MIEIAKDVDPWEGRPLDAESRAHEDHVDPCEDHDGDVPAAIDDGNIKDIEDRQKE